MQTNMADVREIELINQTRNSCLISNSAAISSSEIIINDSAASEDALGQAFPGSGGFEQGSVAFTVPVEECSVSRSFKGNEMISPKESERTNQFQRVNGEKSFMSTAYSFGNNISLQRIGTTENDNEANMNIVDQTVDAAAVDNPRASLLETQQDITPVEESQGGDLNITKIKEITQLQQENTFHMTVVESNQTMAPLGSSKNPIRIIQQGNHYTPVQQLSSEQLQQIMQVVQQQQLAKNTQAAGGSVLFNPNTNSRIVYRIIYPSELHKGHQTFLHISSESNLSTSGSSQQVLLSKRQFRKRGIDDEEDKMAGPEMSREEKEERKKHRPRTRSGRVSKPPRHMIKDYKHIHVLDWDDDYDDSDGGYSDFRDSDEDGHEKSSGQLVEQTPELCAGLLTSSRPKNFKCQTCVKSYIGQAGLERHYRLNPSHGILPDNSGDNGGISCSAGNISEDSNTQDSIPSSSGANSPVVTNIMHRGRGNSRGRGRTSYNPAAAPARKKQKLKELIRSVEDDDLMEVVLPKLVKFVSLWEFLLMKVETCSGSHPRLDLIYKEYLTLHKHVKQACHQSLQLKEETLLKNCFLDDDNEVGFNTLNLKDEDIARSLGFTIGKYSVKDLPLNELTSSHYKYKTPEQRNSTEKNKFQNVAPDEMMVESSYTGHLNLPPVLTSESESLMTGSIPSDVTASSILTSIVSSSGLNDSRKQPASKSLFHSVPFQQKHLNKHHSVVVRSSTKEQDAVEHQQALKSEHIKPQIVAPNVNLVNILKPLSPAMAKHSATLKTVEQSVVVPQRVYIHKKSPSVISLLTNASSNVMTYTAQNHQSSNVQTKPHLLLKTSECQRYKSDCLAGDHSLSANSQMPALFGKEIQQSQTLLTSLVFSNEELTTPHVPYTPVNKGSNNVEDNTSTKTCASVNLVLDCPHVNHLVAVSSSSTGDESCGLKKRNSIHKVPSIVDLNVTDLESVSSDIVQAHQKFVSNTFLPASGEATDNFSCGNIDMYSGGDVSQTLVDNSLQETDKIITKSYTFITEIGRQSHEISVKTDGSVEECDLLSSSQVDSFKIGDACLERPMETDDRTEPQSFVLQQNAVLFQADDGSVILQNPDGSTFQLQGLGEQGLTLQTVQELLGQILSTDSVQAVQP